MAGYLEALKGVHVLGTPSFEGSIVYNMIHIDLSFKYNKASENKQRENLGFINDMKEGT